MMKKVINTILAVLVLANAFVAPALADMCLHETGSDNAHNIEQKMDSMEAPCHHEMTSDEVDHCGNACFCVFASFQQTPSLTSLNLFNNVDSLEPSFFYQDNLTSLDLIPARRPPKFFS